jgi:nitrate/nitrite-specific signal transduction histidine kinase
MTGDPFLSERDLLALVEDARELSHEIDLENLLETILNRASELTSSQSGSIILYDEDKDALFFAAATGPKAQTVLDKFGEHGAERVPIKIAKQDWYTRPVSRSLRA